MKKRGEGRLERGAATSHDWAPAMERGASVEQVVQMRQAHGLTGERVMEQNAQRDAASDASATEGQTKGDKSTYGGDWSTSTYEDYSQGNLRGALIVIHFAPNSTVDADKIGLTQTVKAIQTKKGESKGSPMYGGDKQRGDRALDDGTNLDKGAGQSSPFFADNGASWKEAQVDAIGETYGGSDLSNTAKAQIKSARNAQPVSQFGARHGDTVKDATLRDRSKQEWSEGDTISCTFETTAVAVSGEQEGVYYGSVTWGYDVSADGKITRHPLKVERMGTPSETFAKAAGKWNNAKGYELTRHFDKGAVKKGLLPALMGKGGGNPRYDAWAKKQGISSEWATATVKVDKNEALPIADTKSPAALPGDTSARKAALQELLTIAQEEKDEDLVANIQYELKVLEGSE